MTETLPSVPRLRRGVKLRHDPARGGWVLLAPERAFVLDPIAAEIMALVDGARDEAAIVTALAERFAAPAEVIARDVATTFDDLHGRGVLDR